MNQPFRFLLFAAAIGGLAASNSAIAQATATEWDKHNASGTAAYQHGRYIEAEKSFSAAVTEAEKFGAQNRRLATSLNNLGANSEEQGKYAEAEPLYKHSLQICQKTLGPNHPQVATSLENYAELLYKTNRSAEASKLDQQAKAIRDSRLATRENNPRYAVSGKSSSRHTEISNPTHDSQI